MTSVTLDSVLEQARSLSPDEQARLIEALHPTAAPISEQPASVGDDDLAEQQATWAYLQQVLDEDRLSERRLFPQTQDQP